jgi:hypothetical protein
MATAFTERSSDLGRVDEAQIDNLHSKIGQSDEAVQPRNAGRIKAEMVSQIYQKQAV